MLRKLKLKDIYQDGSVSGASKLSAQGKEMCKKCAELYATHGFRKPWISYLAMDGDLPVGTCAFKGAPQDGVVEIICATLPDHQGTGYGTAMVTSLLRLVRQQDSSLNVMAKTPAKECAATAILLKLNFEKKLEATGSEGERVWEWRLEK